MVQCSVLGCKNRPDQGLYDIAFHRFPTNESHLKLWTQACGRTDWRPTKHARICSKHFDSNCLTQRGNKKFLKPNSLPTKEISIENDIENYLKHKWVGGRVKLKSGVIPHKFKCQNEIEQKPTRSAAEKQSLKKNSKKKSSTRKKLCEEITPSFAPKNESIASFHGNDMSDPLSSKNIDPYLETSKDNQINDEIDKYKINNIPEEYKENNIADDLETSKIKKNTTFIPQATNIRSQEDKMIETAHDVSSIKEENISECRACLQKIYTDSTFYNIFDCWEQQEGMDTTIADNLSSIANIEISESDVYPKVICDVCCSLLQSAYAFAVNVRKSDHILKHKFENEGQEGISEKIWPKPIQINRNIENSIYNADMEIKKEVLSEEECANEISQDYAELDIKIEPEELQSPHIPEKLLVNGRHTLDHLSSETEHLTNGNVELEEQTHISVKEEPISDEDTESTETDLPLECMLCTKIFNSVSGLKAHVIAQHSYKGVKRKLGNAASPEKKKRKYTCTTCRRYFSTSTDLMVHETCHNKSVCYSCNESFDTFSLLIEHRKRCKAVSNKEVPRLKTLEDAKRPHSRESQREIVCSSCNTSLSSLAVLREHQKKYHPNIVYLNNNSNDNDNSQGSWSTGSMSESSN